ncbi:MAG: Ribose import ATP-binding protein RbsA [Chloroflexi bacterium ADurb.Bin344]|nr:MAG: Ribose import ATP-binding protein RbsA [Chloroflexi bacterium ADurb.Bin344]
MGFCFEDSPLRKALIIGNWKMHKTVAEAVAFARALSACLPERPERDVAIAPPFTALHALREALRGSPIALCAQDVHGEDEGPFTGEVSAPMLADVGCRYGLVGHSERRRLFGESNEEVNRKARALLRAGIRPVVCVGESLEEREADQTFSVIRRQLKEGLNNLSADDIIRYMVGRELKEKFPRIQMPVGKTIFEVKNLSAGKAVRDVSFTVREGEILGIAGLMGAGRTETVRAIFGADKKDSGQLILNGQEIRIDKPQEAIETGIFCVPEDRKRDGLCISMPVYQNATLPNMEKVTHRGIVNTKKEIMIAENMVKQLTIHTPSVFQIVKNLSGGNQQKIVVGKWLVKPAHVILFDEPTRGIDVGAKVDIYNLMNQLKEQGIGVVFVSSELPEILGMADRIVVMCEGRVTAELGADEANQEIIMQYATQYM